MITGDENKVERKKKKRGEKERKESAFKPNNVTFFKEASSFSRTSRRYFFFLIRLQVSVLYIYIYVFIFAISFVSQGLKVWKMKGDLVVSILLKSSDAKSTPVAVLVGERFSRRRYKLSTLKTPTNPNDSNFVSLSHATNRYFCLTAKLSNCRGYKILTQLPTNFGTLSN